MFCKQLLNDKFVCGVKIEWTQKGQLLATNCINSHEF